LSCTIFLSSRARLKETLGYFSQPWIFQLRSFCPVSKRLYKLAPSIKVQFCDTETHNKMNVVYILDDCRWDQ
jgi:hypothetical protein